LIFFKKYDNIIMVRYISRYYKFKKENKMKKTAVILCVLLLCAMVLPFTASAATWYIIDNDPIDMDKKAPTLDGVISADEGWSNKADFNEDTVGYFGLPNQYLSGSGNMYFAYTDEGLYFAMDYTDLGAAYCVKFYDEEGNGTHVAVYADANAANYTASDGGFPATTPDGKAVDYYLVDNYTMNVPDVTFPCAAYWRSSLDQYYTNNTLEYSNDVDYLDQGNAGWNGDVFVFSIDPLGLLEEEGFNTEKGINYAIGVTQTGSLKVAHVMSSSDGDVTDACQGKGVINGNKMTFEIMIPWDLIAEHANTEAGVLGLDHNFTAEELAADGATHRGTVIYYDRFYSDDIGDTDTWGVFALVCALTADGTPGYLTSGFSVKEMGLILKNAAASAPESETENDSESQPESGDTTSSGNGGAATTTKNGSTTTKPQSSGNKSTGGSSAQTFDAGIAAAIGALAVSAIGIGYSRKRK